LSFLFYHLDTLDREKSWTLNYGCRYEIPRTGSNEPLRRHP
jgi:outer membrane receptor for monomeric catechols